MKASCVVLWGLSRISLALYNENGERVSIHDGVAIDVIATYAKDRELVIALMTPDIVFLRATLPLLSPRALRKALPYIFEDQCLDEIENLHFAMGEHHPSAPQEVAMINKARLKEVLEILKSVSLVPEVICAGALLSPAVSGVWSVLTHKTLAFMQVSDTAAVVADIDTLPLVLAQAKKVYGEPSEIRETKTVNEIDFIHACFPAQRNAHVLNLLQGEFRQKPKKQVIEHHYFTYLRYGIYTWVGLSVLFPLISWVMLSVHDHTLLSRAESLAKPYTDKPQDIVLAKREMEDKLRQASGTQETTWLRLLAALGQANQAVNSLTIKNLVYEANSLRIEVSAPSPDDLSTWLNALSRSGVGVKQQSSDFIGGHFNATLMVH